MMSNKVILSTAYLPPVQYFTKLIKYEEILIEAYENFIKQTYRNRCNIYGANGIIGLTIPVKKIKTKTIIKDMVIDYDTNWRKMHWKSIESAYRSSAFFEFYADYLAPFYHTKYKFLIDFNHDILKMLTKQLEIDIHIKYTNEYYFSEEVTFDDFREIIHPKKKFHDPDFKGKEYFQVFSDKHGFISNLSILDLLFNTGPETLDYIKK